MKKLFLFLLLAPFFTFGQTNWWTNATPLDHIDINRIIDTTKLYTPSWSYQIKDTTGLADIWKRSSIDTMHFHSIVSEAKLLEITPNNKITFANVNANKSFSIEFEGDSLIVSGDLEPNDQAKLFVDYCRMYIRTKIDSLEGALQFEKDRFNTLSKAVTKFTKAIDSVK